MSRFRESHVTPAYGPIGGLITATSRVLTGSTTAYGTPQFNVAEASTPTMLADQKGYSQLIIRDNLYFNKYLYGNSSTVDGGAVVGTYTGAELNAGASGVATPIANDVTFVRCPATRMEIQTTNTSVGRVRVRHYLIRQKRFNTAYSSPVFMANALFGYYKSNTASGSFVNNAQTIYMPHVSMMKAPTWHRYFEVLEEKQLYLDHGKSKTFYMQIPACHFENLWAQLDANSIPDGLGIDRQIIDDVTLSLVTEIVGDPAVNNDPTTTYYGAALLPSSVAVAAHWQENFLASPSTKILGSIWTAPTQSIGTAVNLGSTSGVTATMNQWGTAAPVDAASNI